ncbi:MAG: hypothetical protein AB8D78_05565 [Akkermansiaceae bacterium]
MSLSFTSAPSVRKRGFPNPILAPVIDWVDRELVDAYVMESGKGGNTLLNLRQLLSDSNLNAAVGGFYRLLPRLERNHFLLTFRIRRWLGMNFDLEISDPMGRVERELVSIRECDRALGEFRTGFSLRSGGVVPVGDVRVQVSKREAKVRESALK